MGCSARAHTHLRGNAERGATPLHRRRPRAPRPACLMRRRPHRTRTPPKPPTMDGQVDGLAVMKLRSTRLSTRVVSPQAPRTRRRLARRGWSVRPTRRTWRPVRHTVRGISSAPSGKVCTVWVSALGYGPVGDGGGRLSQQRRVYAGEEGLGRLGRDGGVPGVAADQPEAIRAERPEVLDQHAGG